MLTNINKNKNKNNSGGHWTSRRTDGGNKNRPKQVDNLWKSGRIRLKMSNWDTWMHAGEIVYAYTTTTTATTMQGFSIVKLLQIGPVVCLFVLPPYHCVHETRDLNFSDGVQISWSRCLEKCDEKKVSKNSWQIFSWV